MSRPVPRVGFVMEQTLGHITHYANLRALTRQDRRIEPAFVPIPFERTGWQRYVPGFGNWTVRAGWRSRRAINELRRGDVIDAMFIHTQVPAILCPDLVRRLPTVVSLDATPLQYDELALHYAHAVGSDRSEGVKKRLNRVCFDRAAAVVTWAEWTKRGLVDGYDVPPEKITVIPPGVELARWTADRSTNGDRSGPVRVLFVGGDLTRKGGLVLLDAVRRLRADALDVALDLVTHDRLAPEPGVTVHHGLRPNDPDLVALYRDAEVFCLPTLGDCLPMVLSEAGAMGLPLVSTDVGAIGEIVRDDMTGFLVPPGNADALTDALRRLVASAALRRRLGDGARDLVRREFDASSNAQRLVELIIHVAAP